MINWWMKMDNQTKEIVGSIIAAVGTIISAVGNTPSSFIKEDLQGNLDLWGNVLQATGNALQVDELGNLSLGTIGNEIQSIGNVTVVAGTIIEFKEEEIEQRLTITGNWLQALGGLVNVADEFEGNTHAGMSENIIGNLLQSIGNSLQAIGGVYELKNDEKDNEKDNNPKNDRSLMYREEWLYPQSVGEFYELRNNYTDQEDHKDSQSLIVSGSWIQAVGSVISVIGQIKEENQEKQLERQ